MISREELDLIVGGAVNSIARTIESVNGRQLTRGETQAVADVVATALALVAARAHPQPAPPPPPAFRERRPAQFFHPLSTQEIRPVTDEDIARARAKQPK
jgi:hypothetical protein